jgi:MioC protein
MNIIMVSASVMGTALGVADHLEKHLQSQHHEVTRSSSLSEWIDLDDTLLLLVTSNTGAGDLPSPASTILTQLITEYPRIAGKHYAIVNLGDSSYATFGEGGQKLNNALQDIGAIEAYPMLTLDAISGDDPEQSTIDWWDEVSR